MKIFVKALKFRNFEMEVHPSDLRAIETFDGPAYPFGFQKLIHHGRVLEDDTTLLDNNVVEYSIIFLSKHKVTTGGASTAPALTQRGT